MSTNPANIDDIRLLDSVVTETGAHGQVVWFHKIGDRWFARVNLDNKPGQGSFVFCSLNALRKVHKLDVKHL